MLGILQTVAVFYILKICYAPVLAEMVYGFWVKELEENITKCKGIKL